MKTSRILNPLALTLFIITIAFTGCKKESIEATDDTTSVEQLSNDENTVESVTDDALKDVEGVMSGQVNGMKSTSNIPCNATLDSIGVENDTVIMYITYNGLNCNGTRNRVGQVEIRKKVGTHWGLPLSSINVRYINFAVTRVSTGRTITINGSKTFQNVSGGFVWQLGENLTAIIHKVEGSMNVTFDNGTTRSWNVARKLTYTGVPGSLLLTVEGFGNSGDYTNLVTWGTNRHGEQFFTQINQAVVHKELCGWDPVSGIKVHTLPGIDRTATITFGYNSNNEPITGNECPTKFRLDWTHGSNSGTKYILLP